MEHHVLALWRADQLLFARRPEKGLWSNMWELPTVEGLDTDGNVTRSLSQWVRQEFGIRVRLMRAVGEFCHQTTHRRINFVVWTARVASNGCIDGRMARQWRNLRDTGDLPLSNPQRKILAMLAGDPSD